MIKPPSVAAAAHVGGWRKRVQKGQRDRFNVTMNAQRLRVQSGIFLCL